MNKALAFESGLQKDRQNIFKAPPPSGSIPTQSQNDNKSKRDLLWEQKRQQRFQSNPSLPQKHVSFSPNLVDPTQLPPPPFKDQKPQELNFAQNNSFQGINQLKPAIKMSQPILSPRNNAPSFQKFSQNDFENNVPSEFQHAVNQYSNIQDEPINQPSLGQSALYSKKAPELAVFDDKYSLNNNNNNNGYRSQPPVSHSRASAGPPSGKDPAKQEYLRELQTQMQSKKMRQKEEKRKQIEQDRSQIKQMDRYAPWGASARQNYGAGAPLRDQGGNIVTSRSNAISNPYTSALNPKPARNFTSVQSQPNLYPNSSYMNPAENRFQPPLSPQVNSGGAGGGYQPYVPGSLGGGINQSAPQHFGYHSKNSSQASNLAAVGNDLVQPPSYLYNQKQPQFAPANEGFQPRPIDMNFPQSGQNLHYERKPHPLSAHGPYQSYAPPPQPQQQFTQFEQQARRSQTPLGMTAANNIAQSKYVTKIVDENLQKKKHAQMMEYQQELKRQIEQRERAKNQKERLKKQQQRKQEERLQRERKQIEQQFKQQQEKKKKQKNDVSQFNLQNAGGNDGGHVVVSKNPKAAAKRREAELFEQKRRVAEQNQNFSNRAKRQELFGGGGGGGGGPPQQSVFGNVVQFSDANIDQQHSNVRSQKKQFSETRIIENVSKQIRKNMDVELENLRHQINRKEDNFQRQVGQLKQQAKRAQDEKFKSQQELQDLKRKLEDNKLRDIKYEHELALALKKTDGSGHPGAGLRAEFLSKPTSQLLPIGQDPRPNIINPNIKGLLPEDGGTFKTLRHQSQLIPVGAGQQTLMGAGILQNNSNNLYNQGNEAPVIGMQAQNRAPVIITHPGQIGDNKKKAELSLSLNGSAQQVNIPNLDSQNRNPYDSFPSIPDVNNTGKQRQGNTTVNQTLDGFTINSINLNKMNKKNHDRLANLQQKENLNYQQSDPKDELAKLDDLLFSLLKSDDNNPSSQQGKRPASKQNAINFEQQVRGMIQDQSQQVGGGRGINFNNRQHSLRSFEADNQIYRDQMNEIYSGNNNPAQLQMPRQHGFAYQNQQYMPPTQKTLGKLPGQDTFNIDSFVMADTRKLDTLKGITFKNEDSLQGINTMSLQGGGGGGGNPKTFQQRQQTISTIRGGVGGGGHDLDSIDEAPDENSFKHISDALSGGN